MVSDTDPTPRKTNTTKSRQPPHLTQQQRKKRQGITSENDEVSALGEASLASPTGVEEDQNPETAASAMTADYPACRAMMESPFEPNITSQNSPHPVDGDGETCTDDGDETPDSNPPPPTPTTTTTTTVPPALISSRRFKGYLTILLASIINYNAAVVSDEPIDISAVPAEPSQAKYAMSVALLSAIVTGVVVVIHMDRYSPLEDSLWRPAFSPTSKVESILIVLLFTWWSVATIVQTSVGGIAGDGKEQYNLYYSVWACWWTCLWVAERKLVDLGYPTVRTFVTGWPHRAPGWIAIFITDFFTLWWYVDAFRNIELHPERIPEQLVPFYEHIPRSQYQWLIFIAAFTLLPSAIFIVAEIVRAGGSGGGDEETVSVLPSTAAIPTTTTTTTDTVTTVPATQKRRRRPKNNLSSAIAATIDSGQRAFSSSGNAPSMTLQRQKTQPTFRQPEKKSGETIFEGFCLLCLGICWIISVIVATTPGGFASQVGNSYFSTWITTAFVLDTGLWFVHDWRKRVHQSLEEKELEYRRHQQQVLQATLQKLQLHHHHHLHVGGGASSTGEGEFDEDEDYMEDEDDDDDDDAPRSDDDHDKEPDDERHWRASPRREDRRMDEPSPRYGFPQQDHLDEHSETYDSHVAEELRMKQENEKAYFDTLGDIFE